MTCFLKYLVRPARDFMFVKLTGNLCSQSNRPTFQIGELLASRKVSKFLILCGIPYYIHVAYTVSMPRCMQGDYKFICTLNPALFVIESSFVDN
jgi:hypothetical protein